MSNTLKVIVFLVVFGLTAMSVNGLPKYTKNAYVCDQRYASRRCLLGCLHCLEYYGPKIYHLSACCYDCRDSNVPIIDNGPEKCSRKYMYENWMEK